LNYCFFYLKEFKGVITFICKTKYANSLFLLGIQKLAVEYTYPLKKMSFNTSNGVKERMIEYNQYTVTGMTILKSSLISYSLSSVSMKFKKL
jgi:hypothetical protein